MNGRDLTLGLVGALALGAAVGRRGSASATEVAAVLPEPGPPPAGMKPRWASSWTKGKAWAREQLLQHPATYDPRDALAVLDAADRKVIEDNTLGLPSLDRLEGKLRGGLIDRVRPKVLAEAARLRGVADRKSRGAASVDERAFWTGVGDYTAEVLGAATDADGMARAEALLDAVEANLVRAWMRKKREGSAARTESGMGRYRFVTNCIGSTYEDISAMKETATGVSRATFARAVGPEQWKWIQKELGYDRDFRISGDWHVGYDTGTYRGVPAYWLTHSAIEWIFTLDGEEGKSLARRRGSRAMDWGWDDFPDEPEPEPSPLDRAWRAFSAARGAPPEHIDADDLFRAWPEGVDRRVGIVPRHVRGADPGWFVYASEARTEADARRVGKRVHAALVAPRSLRADQPRLHELPLTVGWSGGTVEVGAAR